jgi:hypothetical protein
VADFVRSWIGLGGAESKRFSAADAAAISGINFVTLQNWANRKTFEPKEGGGGKGRKRLYSTADIVTLALLNRMALLGLQPMAASAVCGQITGVIVGDLIVSSWRTKGKIPVGAVGPDAVAIVRATSETQKSDAPAIAIEIRTEAEALSLAVDTAVLVLPFGRIAEDIFSRCATYGKTLPNKRKKSG